MEYIEYETLNDFDVYTEGTVISDKNMTSIMFKNIGETDATINGVKLSPGDPAITFGSSIISKDITEYNLAFDSQTGLDNRMQTIRTRIVNAHVVTALPRTCKPKKSAKK